jgi:hypothetical protein
MTRGGAGDRRALTGNRGALLGAIHGAVARDADSRCTGSRAFRPRRKCRSVADQHGKTDTCVRDRSPPTVVSSCRPLVTKMLRWRPDVIMTVEYSIAAAWAFLAARLVRLTPYTSWAQRWIRRGQHGNVDTGWRRCGLRPTGQVADLVAVSIDLDLPDAAGDHLGIRSRPCTERRSMSGW